MLRLGFLGAGRMAHALANGFLAAGLTKADAIIASCDPSDNSSIESFQKLGANVLFCNSSVMKQCNVIFLAVKPVVVPLVLRDIKPVISEKHLLLSIAMGISIEEIEMSLPKDVRVIRVMPNTPATVRCAASVFSCGSAVRPEDINLTKKLFDSIGTCEEVPETYMDPITALSGSGPAYVYAIMEALCTGGVRMGLPRELARRLVTQTVLGAAKTAVESNQHLSQLCDDVTSPAGSTAEALYWLEQSRLRAALIGAVEVATKRCKEVNLKR
ncbi:pyrroline-5-carboxylate reductase 3 [Schistocerca cancellata]|uniref:pyrroline-5-carboxylate reductase 3 n=1 Tax=Schistocerca cancellata TaxID=274614 RepID=UPI002118D24D|nr:pyrroline-5-carboxylate reductase 3 [Schistocerca cancellata]